MGDNDTVGKFTLLVSVFYIVKNGFDLIQFLLVNNNFHTKSRSYDAITLARMPFRLLSEYESGLIFLKLPECPSE